MEEVTAPNFDAAWPSVSAVMPVRNEAKLILAAVEAVLSQEYEGDIDIWIAVAPSDDETEQIVGELAQKNPKVHLVRNDAGVTPAGLNAAISASSGDVVVRVDGHAKLCDGYIARAVETMIRTGAVNVGGRQVATGVTGFERAVAAVMMSVVGSGGAEYRVGETEKVVDTVFLGVFDRRAGDEVGWFDESLIRNQDYELNIRLRASGGLVWFDPHLFVEYRPRSSLRAVARQYYDYGIFKARVLKLHRSSLKFRQIIPPIAMLGLALSLMVGIWFKPALLIIFSYLAVLFFGVRGPARSRFRALLIAPAMHLSWSAGLLAGFVKWRKQNPER